MCTSLPWYGPYYVGHCLDVDLIKSLWVGNCLNMVLLKALLCWSLSRYSPYKAFIHCLDLVHAKVCVGNCLEVVKPFCVKSLSRCGLHKAFMWWLLSRWGPDKAFMSKLLSRSGPYKAFMCRYCLGVVLIKPLFVSRCLDVVLIKPLLKELSRYGPFLTLRYQIDCTSAPILLKESII